MQHASSWPKLLRWQDKVGAFGSQIVAKSSDHVRPHSSCSPHLLPGRGKEKHRQHAIQAIAMSPTLRKRLATINLQRSQFIPSVGDGFFKLGWLVVSTPLKNISQNGNLPQIGVNIKNVWNQHLVGVLYFTKKKGVQSWTYQYLGKLSIIFSKAKTCWAPKEVHHKTTRRFAYAMYMFKRYSNDEGSSKRRRICMI